MTKFDIISAYKDKDVNLPKRKTKHSAGYDFEVAEDIIVPSYYKLMKDYNIAWEAVVSNPKTLEELARFTKINQIKPTLIPTGIKCYLKDNQYLELSVRSSCPLKYWIILANGVGIIDSDYVDNPDNEGHIYFQVINLSPYDIQLKKGDAIGQGIIRTYELTDDDNSNAERIGGFGSTDNIQQSVQNKKSPIDDSYQIHCSSHCEGRQNQAQGQSSHAEGTLSFAQTMENLANAWSALNNNIFTAEEVGEAFSTVSKRLAGVRDYE